ncbi:Uncharacterised protein [Mycobacteroides abscessus subsp. abscessus]|uniref:hypothetical protein n=1 Tax=Mycobacteroides abscessus TaxID=36809 RepID=UPI00092B2AE6|nr:hypothetical protein [Mycobacteroides abscessus]SHT27291.1 Uncharacterised protein [Mycobacteroides abscessus subsp. abscessus]
MSPDQIQAIGGVIVAILGAWQGLTSKRVRNLETRLRAVETERDLSNSKLRAAVRHIREWMLWALRHAPGKQTPAVPAELRDEI